MPRGRKSDVVGGFDVYRAAQRAAEEKRPAKDGDAQAPAEPAPDPQGKKIGAHIGRTAMPTKHDVICYECGYAFQITGSIVKHTICSKCRNRLVVDNPVIDGAWSGEIKTAGTVHVKRGGHITGGTIRTTHMILEGDIGEEAVVQVFRRLEIRDASKYREDCIEARDLVIGEGAAMIQPAMSFHDVEVSGTLRTSLTASGAVTVRKGGALEGDVVCSSIGVEDGGVLLASVRVEPTEAPKELVIPSASSGDEDAARSA